jgi:hypothetical protein
MLRIRPMMLMKMKKALTQKYPWPTLLVLSLIIPTSVGAITRPMFWMAVAMPKAVPTVSYETTYGIEPQIAAA